VESFLEQVAADYQLALDAIAASGDPYGSVGREIGDVLRYAKESADKVSRAARDEARKIVNEATEEATRIREDAAGEAAQTLQTARAEAARLHAEADSRVREIEDDNRVQRRRSEEDAAELRRQAEEEAAGTLETAGEKAVSLVREAERHALELRETAESKYHQRLDEATQRHAKLQAQERDLNQRAVEVAKTLQRLLAQLRPEDRELTEGLAAMTEVAGDDRIVDLRENGERDRSQQA
jgi:hypothetical protein